MTGEQELFHIGEDLYQKEEKGYIFDKSQKMMKENLIVDTFQSKGKNFYISSRQNMLSGWKIIQVIPEERLFEEVDQKIKWNSIFLLGALILVVSFSIYYTKKIIEPLEEFCKKISHTKGDQLQIINLEHMKLTREIANVIENYNEMANKMNEYLVREIIYDKNQKKIQSKMLRYQINPHFLYNTLNLIASMGELSDFPEIVEITKNLSCIMQYNVKGSRFVSLKTEVEMVKAYLEIQRIRFHDCFSVEYDLVVKDELSPNPAALTAMGKGADAMFRNQKVAMESAGLWMLPTYKENPLPFEWDVVRMPMDKNQNTKAGILNWGISKSTKNPEAAWDLLKFLCGPEGNRIVAESNMALPGSTDKEALQIVLDSKFPSNVKAFVDSVPDCDLKDQLSIYRTEVNTKVQQLVDEMLIGKSTPEETQEKLIKEINAILAN